ncbi:hypothetical protein L6164_011181 [Bauhinia variegata]|uniref:Uncharacterized protein n=1 Tax=Bauhinia variegata TaxID=167791 RepID=A0ACB9P7P1_BAUVA|nr:hypothetical protein L6164_011181 [Bauhinia variegata]
MVGSSENLVASLFLYWGLSHVGNNRYLSRSLAQASLPWYGIDFGNGLPNGRFSNGRTVADIMDRMGLPRSPAFVDPSLTEDVILETGVNYASGGGGILNESGSYFIHRFSLYKQIELFQGTQELVRSKIGKEAADDFFQEARYVVVLGSNDFIKSRHAYLHQDCAKIEAGMCFGMSITPQSVLTSSSRSSSFYFLIKQVLPSPAPALAPSPED